MAGNGGRSLGELLGVVTAPLVQAGSWIRGSRLFHPVGTIWRAEVTPSARHPDARALANRLEGPALVRLSGATWKRRGRPDILGFAIRFREHDRPDAEPAPGDQDLLLATIPHLWSIPAAFFRTESHDYLANTYHSVTRFGVPRLGRSGFRVRGIGESGESGESGEDGSAGDRKERLAQAVARGEAEFELEVCPRGGDCEPVARIRLIEQADLRGEDIHFDPYVAGRGIRPVGFVNGIRRIAYPVGQAARPG